MRKKSMSNFRICSAEGAEGEGEGGGGVQIKIIILHRLIER